MALTPVPSPDQIVRLYKSGELPAELAQYHEDEDIFLQHCVALHNAGDVDLTAVPSQAAFDELNGHPFFTAQHFYCEAIPELDANTSALMECCKILVDKAGADGVANQPYAAFRTWCLNNPGKGAVVIRSARADDPLAKRFVTFALQAANDVDEAIHFVNAYADDRRLSGMAALAGMTFADGASIQNAIAVLEPHVADRCADHLRSNALLAVFGVLKQHEDREAVQRLIELAIQSPGPATLNGLARVVWLHHTMLDFTTLQLALAALQAVEPEHRGTLHEIDMGLQHLLGTPNERLALDFLTEKLQDEKFKIDNFEVVGHHLTSGSRQRLYELIVRWFLVGNIALCNNVSKLLDVEDRAFDATVQPLALTPGRQLLLCHKAIGFLFLKPVCCCSIIVSVLRGVDEKIEEPAAELLFDPMLLNYSGDLADYLKGIPAADAAFGTVQGELAKSEAFHAGLRAAGTIKELHPSEFERDVMRQRVYDEMRIAHKLAESKSVFFGLIPRATILYGKRSLTYVTDEDGKQRPVEVDMKSFKKSFEIPRWEILDPVGLDYMLRSFRAVEIR
jgi:hypothetical protein